LRRNLFPVAATIWRSTIAASAAAPPRISRARKRAPPQADAPQGAASSRPDHSGSESTNESLPRFRLASGARDGWVARRRPPGSRPPRTVPATPSSAAPAGPMEAAPRQAPRRLSPSLVGRNRSAARV